MHNHYSYCHQKTVFPLTDQVSTYMQNADVEPILTGPTFRDINFQPSNACPRNFIIFDQTNNQNHVMFHPEISSKLVYPGFGFDAPPLQNEKNANNKRKVMSTATTFKEDSADIDALLSTEMEESEECDEEDDVLSTARTTAAYDCYSPDTCSNYTSMPSKSKSFLKKPYSPCNDKKRQRVRKMVNTLRGIVPGGNHMSSVAVLDEAVQYLKSLRVEVQKLGNKKL